MAAFFYQCLYPSALPAESRNKARMVKTLVLRQGIPYITLQMTYDIRVNSAPVNLLNAIQYIENILGR